MIHTPALVSREYPGRMVWLAACLVIVGVARESSAQPEMVAQLYQKQCAWCHGANGEGVIDEYAQPLAGNRSIEQLTRLIDKTMPADDPDACSGDDARAMAQYVYDTYYSPVAQARNALPRVELQRLTVRQHRNVLTDLVGSFRGQNDRGDERGLKASYYDSRSFRDRERRIERVDPQVVFDFGTDSPDPEKLKDPNTFSIQWSGAVLAPDTGEYEFIVRTDHAVRLYVNNTQVPLIDAWVKSGDDTEFKGSITLLGGRAYPLRLEFTKAIQGVEDQVKERPKVPATITLAWNPPHGPEQVIPGRLLSPGWMPEVFVTTVPFPPDDRSAGYERGVSVSETWEDANTQAAIETASYIESHLNELAGTRSDRDDRADKIKAFARLFVERAFRRPLTDAEQALYVDRQLEEAGALELGVKRVVLLALTSPRFLFRELARNERDDYLVAERLALGLWDSLPDQRLLDAAKAGTLHTLEQVEEQASRMVADPRTRSKMREFLLQWLRVDLVPDLAKDSSLFPEFDPQVIWDLRTSLDLFLDEVVWSEASDFRQLLQDEGIYLNGRLAALYGADLPPDADFQKVKLTDGPRAGVLSHPYLMATFSYTATSSPIHRGVFLSRSVLGRSLRPPPIAVAPLAPDLHPGLTTRERVTLQTEPETCQGCHAMINNLGFTLEQFDAIGRYRTEEYSKPIDSTGFYQAPDGETTPLGGLKDLADFTAESGETHTALVEQLFHYMVKQPIRAYGALSLQEMTRQFEDDGFQIRHLLVQIMATSALGPGSSAPGLAANETPTPSQ